MAATASKKWSGAFAAPAKQSKSTPNVADVQQREGFKQILRSRAPGQWTDNRLEQSQHLLGAVFVAVKVLADQAASAEVSCYKLKPNAKHAKDKDAKESLPYTHELSNLMRQPNPKETGGMLRRKMVQQICLTGISTLWQLTNGFGRPAEHWSIPTGTWQAVPRSPLFPEGGYRVTPYYAYGPFGQLPGLQQAGTVIIPSREILRTELPHPLIQYDAYSPLTACALQLDSLEAIDKSRWHAMKQGVNPSAVVELDGAVAFPEQDELDRLKQEFATKYGGPEQAGRVAVLSPGATMKPWSHSPSDMGWEASWSQLVDFVLSVFGVTKSLAFMTTESSYASLYASLKQFNLFSLCPLLQLIADSINVQMVWPYFGPDHYVDIEPAAIDDKDQKEQELASDDSIGLYTINERRIMRGYPPVEWGDVRALPGSVGMRDPGASLADTDPANDDPAVASTRPESGLGEGSLPGDVENLPPLGKSLRSNANGHYENGYLDAWREEEMALVADEPFTVEKAFTGEKQVSVRGKQQTWYYRDGKRVPGPNSKQAAAKKPAAAKPDPKKTAKPPDAKPAGKTKKDPAPKPASKPAKQTPEQRVAHGKSVINDFRAGKGDARGLAAALAKFTVKELDAIKKELGFTASGLKAQKALKIAEQALGAAGAAKKTKPEDEKPPAKPDADNPDTIDLDTLESEPEPEKKEPEQGGPGSKLRGSLKNAYKEATRFLKYQDGLVDLPFLYERMKKVKPDLTPEQFKKELFNAWGEKEAPEGKLELHVLNETGAIPDPNKVMFEHNDKQIGFAYWHEPKRKQP